jgi:signal transduction histidine kinase
MKRLRLPPMNLPHWIATVRRHRVVAMALVPAVLLVPLGALSLRLNQQRVDFAKAQSTVRELKRVDEAWSADSLRLSSGLLADYDPLTRSLAIAAGEERELEAVARQAQREDPAAWSAALTGLLQRHREAMARKMDLLELIKSQQSILRNSTHFLPIAHAELAASMRGLAQAPRGEAMGLINALLVDTMAYLRDVRPDIRARLEANLGRLQALADGWPQGPRERAAAVLTHTRLVVEQRRRGDLLLRELLGVPDAACLDAIAERFADGQAAMRQDQELYKRVLAAYVGLLLAALGMAGWLLARSYRKLNVTNERLRQANEATQVQLIQSAKMAAMGRMAAGLAHEINTPLAYVKATLAVLKEKLVDARPANSAMTEELAALFGDGLYGIEQISTLVLTLKNFSRLDLARVTQFSVEEGLDSSLLLARYTLKHVAEVRKEYGGVPRISCSPAQLNQVFLNIIINAAHAMGAREGKGLLVVRTSVEGESVRVDIKDNGTGIPKHVLPRIFDPFFTTKKIGEGSGTGLSLAYRIIESHGGSIRVETDEGIGTTFSVLLPIHSSEERQAELKKADAVAM